MWVQNINEFLFAFRLIQNWGGGGGGGGGGDSYKSYEKTAWLLTYFPHCFTHPGTNPTNAYPAIWPKD